MSWLADLFELQDTSDTSDERRRELEAKGRAMHEAHRGGDCTSCTDDPTEICPKSQRACGHHCEHVWTHDECHWCGWVVPEHDGTPDALAGEPGGKERG